MKYGYTERICTAQEIQQLVSNGGTSKTIIATGRKEGEYRNVNLLFASRLKGTIMVRETPWEILLLLTRENLAS